MARQPRKARPNLKYEGYDSKFEYDLHQTVLKGCERNTQVSVSYNVQKKYFPDFIYKKGPVTFYLETKGRFWDSDEYSKYKHARLALVPEIEEIVFIFYNPEYPMPKAQKRKNGTKMTHAEWATNNGFRFFTKETFNVEEL